MVKKSEETIPVEEVKVPTFVSIKNFIKSVLIILLSFFCIIIGVFIYQLNVITPSDTQRRTVMAKQMRQPKPRKLPSIPQNFELTGSKSLDMPLTIEKEKIPPDTVIAEEPIPETPIISEQKQNSTLTEETIIEKKPRQDSKLMLKDLLILKNHLDNGESCFADFKGMVNQKGFSNQSELMQALMPICASPKTNFDSIEKAFLIERKKALMTYYRMNNPKWLAYTKAFLSSLVDVRRLNPKKQRPKDLLSLAQNALKQKNMEQALMNIQKLPPEMKADFPVFISDATLYVQAQHIINTSILTFEDKGE